MKNVILVVDMIKGFHNIGNLKNPRTALIIPNIRELLDRKMTEGGWVAVFLADCHQRDDKEFEMFLPHCIEGTKETEIIDELNVFSQLGNNLVLPKTRYSGFYETNLDEVIEELNPEKVVVVGVCTDICVLHTVVGLRNMDLNVIVPKDCTETYGTPGHSARKTKRWALRHMENILGATIIESQKEI